MDGADMIFSPAFGLECNRAILVGTLESVHLHALESHSAGSDVHVWLNKK